MADDPIDNLFILSMRILGDQISEESLETFVQSKELRTELNKAVNAAMLAQAKSSQPADPNTLPASVATDAVGKAAQAYFSGVYDKKYSKEVDKNVSAIKENVTGFLKTKLVPGVYLTDNQLLLFVIGLAGTLAVTEGPAMLKKVQDVCKPNQDICSVASKITVLKHMKTKKIGDVTLGGGGQLAFSPTYEDMKTEYIGELTVKGLKVGLKLDVTFDVADRKFKYKNEQAALTAKQAIDKNWSVEFSAQQARDTGPKTDGLQLNLKGDYTYKDRQLSLDVGYSTVGPRPDVTVKASLTLFNF